jgi:serine phosphatase RsbU (regulator of sigma subunit)
MLRLKNFVDFPLQDQLVSEIASVRSGLIIISGMDPRMILGGEPHDTVLPSGRSTIFSVLIQEILTVQFDLIASVISHETAAFRPPRSLKQRVNLYHLDASTSFSIPISEALQRGSEFIAIDRLDVSTLPLALQIAEQNKLVIGQLDCALWGASVQQYLLDLGALPEQLNHLKWIISVHRIQTLCAHCKQEDPHFSEKISSLRHTHPGLFLAGKPLEKESGLRYFQASNCEYCKGSGRSGDTLAIDIFRSTKEESQPSDVSLEECIAYHVRQGALAIDDLIGLEKDQLRRTNHLLVSREKSLLATENILHSRLAELEASNRVLNRKTEEMISLYDLSHVMLSSIDLDALAQRICLKVSSLSKADRIALYYLVSKNSEWLQGDVLGIVGWSGDDIHRRVDLPAEFHQTKQTEVKRYIENPPGLFSPPPKNASDPPIRIKSGIRIPLLAQETLIGWMFVQSTQKRVFSPGETALLQTLGSQAALAIQRAGLIDNLQNKISQLQAAQAELLIKERLDRELELARQVQQSLLPQVFPETDAYRFSAINLPARQMGGDFYDVIQLDADHLGIVIADVSDKGMPAAIYMALSRSLLLAEAHRSISPMETLLRVNHLLLELGEAAEFLAVFYGVIECSTHRLVYTRAGHDRPLILRHQDIVSLEGRGAVLGILDQTVIGLSEEEFFLQPGDRMILYTDGLTDAINPQKETFGLDRFSDLVSSLKNQPLSEMGKMVLSKINAYQENEEQYDDMTLLLLDVY